MSLSECQRMVRIEKFCYMIEIGDTAMNIVRNCIPMRNCMLRERLWSESHFRLVSTDSEKHDGTKASKTIILCFNNFLDMCCLNCLINTFNIILMCFEDIGHY